MSERRMFSKSVTESDIFLDLPFPAQALYFHLSMNADDEGFINNVKRIQRICQAEEKDLERLLEKSFLIKFDSGIYCIKHWKINNRIRPDRKHSTNYPEEKALLVEKANGVYSLKENGAEGKEIKSVEEEQENYAKEIVAEAEKQSEKAEEKAKANYEMTSEPRKDYAEQIFEVLLQHKLPCCNGNLIAFTMRDFKLALPPLNELHLRSEEVIQAVKNYAEVIELKRQGVSWWSSEQTFNAFCEKKTILKFLPENFKVEDFYKNKSDIPRSETSDKIEL